MMSRQKDAVTSVTMPDAMHLASERVAQAYCSFMKSHVASSVGSLCVLSAIQFCQPHHYTTLATKYMEPLHRIIT